MVKLAVWRGTIGGAGDRSTPASALLAASASSASRSNGTAAACTSSAKARSMRCSAPTTSSSTTTLSWATSREGRLMVPFDDYLSATERSLLRTGFRRHVLAVLPAGRPPVGAADRCGLPGRVYRPDLMAPYGAVPAHHDEVLELGRAPAQGRQMARPAAGPDRRHVPDPDADRSAGRRRRILRGRGGCASHRAVASAGRAFAPGFAQLESRSAATTT